MNPLEQLCIKKAFLKEEECKSCKGYDGSCPNYEEIEREQDNPLKEELYLQQHKYTTEKN